MSLETGDYINDLTITNPVSADPKSAGDDHLRLLKKVLKECLNGFSGGILLRATETGTAAVHVLTPTTALVAYVTGQMLLYSPVNAGTGALTVNVSALGAKSVKTIMGADPTSGDITANQPILLVYDGTNFVLLAGSEFLGKTGNQTMTGNLTLTGNFTPSGTVTLPATTSIGTVSATEILYLDGVTSAIQTQLNLLAPIASPTLTGVPAAPTATTGTSTTQLATTAFVAAAAFNVALPAQAGNNGKYVTTDGTNASWGTVTTPAAADPTGTIAGAAVNGSASTFMRSDAAPALSLTIAQLNTAVTDADLAILGANTFTAAQEFATGTAIASAATINLNTSTGNRVHITGTTTITAVTLTRGPRTVIFDGILTLTHHATNNNLPGAANITTAAGDRAIYESDGTTVYCVSYIKASGAAVVAASSAVNYPQLIKSANYTLVLADAGYQIFHPASDTASRTFTIPSNASVAYAIGTVLVFVNPKGAKDVTVSITTDTLIDVRGVTGPRTFAMNNILTALKITATRWMCYFADNDNPMVAQFLAIAHSTSPFVTAYPWSSSGFGTKFANPATLPTGIGNGAAFSPAGTELAIAHTTTPFVTAYPWSSSGFGTKFANPATLPSSTGWSAAFSPAGTELVIGHSTSPFVTAYPWSSSGFGTKFADPATLPTAAGNGAAFSPAGTELAIAHGTSPYVAAYPWSSSGFGTKFANPATLPTGTGWSAAFSPAGTELAIAHATSLFVTAYPWSSSGFGTKFADPATLPTGIGNGAAFSPAGTELAIAHDITPYVTAYPWSSSGFGTKFADPATVPTGEGLGAAFSPAGTELAIGHMTSPYVTAYPWSSSGFGTKFANPATLPTGEGNGAAFSQS